MGNKLLVKSQGKNNARMNYELQADVNEENQHTLQENTLGFDQQILLPEQRMRRAPVEAAIRAQIIELYLEGNNPAYIGCLMNRPRMTVSSII